MLFLGQTLANAVPISPPPLAGITTPDPLRNEVPGVQPRRYAWGSRARHSDFDVLTRLYPLGCRLPHLYIDIYFLPLSLTAAQMLCKACRLKWNEVDLFSPQF